MSPTNSSLRAALSVLAGAVLISFAAVFVRLADVAPTTSAFYRMLFGAATLAVLLLLRPAMRAGWRENWGGSVLIAELAGWRIVLSPQAVGLAVAFAFVIGVFFGFYPARKAARLNPVEALRFE